MVDSYRAVKLGERAFKGALLSIPSVQTVKECNQNKHGEEASLAVL